MIVAETGGSPARIYRRLGFERFSGFVELSADPWLVVMAPGGATSDG